MTDAQGYHFNDRPSCGHHHAYLLPVIEDLIQRHKPSRIFDLGCGDGSVVAHLVAKGHVVRGVDPSEDGVRAARRAYPNLEIEQGSGYDDLAAKYGEFPLVISLEVIEHLYDPRFFLRNLMKLVEKGGTIIVSTPYHGYWKNLALTITGKMDSHFTALWDHGHIKFWSIRTLGLLLREAGFADVEFIRVGRIPLLAKSMIAIARKPGLDS